MAKEQPSSQAAPVTVLCFIEISLKTQLSTREMSGEAMADNPAPNLCTALALVDDLRTSVWQFWHNPESHWSKSIHQHIQHQLRSNQGFGFRIFVAWISWNPRAAAARGARCGVVIWALGEHSFLFDIYYLYKCECLLCIIIMCGWWSFNQTNCPLIGLGPLFPLRYYGATI